MALLLTKAAVDAANAATVEKARTGGAETADDRYEERTQAQLEAVQASGCAAPHPRLHANAGSCEPPFCFCTWVVPTVSRRRRGSRQASSPARHIAEQHGPDPPRSRCAGWRRPL